MSCSDVEFPEGEPCCRFVIENKQESGGQLIYYKILVSGNKSLVNRDVKVVKQKVEDTPEERKPASDLNVSWVQKNKTNRKNDDILNEQSIEEMLLQSDSDASSNSDVTYSDSDCSVSSQHAIKEKGLSCGSVLSEIQKNNVQRIQSSTKYGSRNNTSCKVSSDESVNDFPENPIKVEGARKKCLRRKFRRIKNRRNSIEENSCTFHDCKVTSDESVSDFPESPIEVEGARKKCLRRKFRHIKNRRNSNDENSCES